MKGTQLTQLSEDYELIRESIESIHNIMKRKRELLPELHKEAKDAEMKYKEMQQARELEVTVARLKNEMAWAQVDEIEYVSNFNSECETDMIPRAHELIWSFSKWKKLWDKLKEQNYVYQLSR